MSYSSNSTSPAEIYAFNFQNPEPKYYARVPHIIDHLTYKIEKDGVIQTKRLSVYAKELYRVIRMIASDGGVDWHKVESLAEIVGCSVGSIVNAKKELLMPMDQLDGSPLIIETRKQIHKDVNGQHIVTTLCTRTIIDIWRWNNAFMATIKNQVQYGRITHSLNESEIDQIHHMNPPPPPDSPHESAPQTPDSPHEANKNKQNNNPLFKEQQPTTEVASVCSFKEKLSSVQLQAYDWLLKIGCSIKTTMYFINNFSTDEIENASRYLKNQMSKKEVPNIVGYLRKILEGKWWIKKNKSFCRE